MFMNISLENKECILTGDMNCNYLVDSDHKELKSILTAFGFKQLIRDPTRVTHDSRSLIDVIYTNEPWNIYSVKGIPAGLSDHDLVGCIRKIHSFKYQPKLYGKTASSENTCARVAVEFPENVLRPAGREGGLCILVLLVYELHVILLRFAP